MAYTRMANLFATGLVQKAVKSVASDVVKIENPLLLLVLPASIVVDNVLPASTSPSFDCPNRERLHNECTEAAAFDKLTIPPVNRVLNNKDVPLTNESLNALRADINHSKQMSISDPVHKKIEDYHEQHFMQRDIARSFARAGEHEGALLHKGLAGGFQLRAHIYEHGIAPFERAIRPSMD